MGRPGSPIAVELRIGRVRKPVVGVVVVHQRQTDLLQVVVALHAIGGFADFLDRWQQQPNENGNDGDDDKQLDQGEPAAPLPRRSRHGNLLDRRSGKVKRRFQDNGSG